MLLFLAHTCTLYTVFISSSCYCLFDIFSGLRTRIDEYVSSAHPDSSHTGSVGGASPRDSQHLLPQIENHMCKWHPFAI